MHACRTVHVWELQRNMSSARLRWLVTATDCWCVPPKTGWVAVEELHLNHYNEDVSELWQLNLSSLTAIQTLSKDSRKSLTDLSQEFHVLEHHLAVWRFESIRSGSM